MLCVTAQAADSSPLGPENLALLYNLNSETSKQLAEHYAKQRGVPVDQILGLDLPLVDTLPRAHYEQGVVPAVRRALAQTWKDKPICCLVTFYDVPIRIGTRHPSPEETAEIDGLSRMLDRQLLAYSQALDELDKVGQSNPPVPQTPKLDRAKEPVQFLNDRYQRAVANASRRLSQIEPPEGQKVPGQTLWALIERIEGGTGIVGRMRPNENASPSDIQRYQMARDRLATLQRELSTLLKADLVSPEHVRARELTQTVFGVKGVVELIDLDLKLLNGDHSLSAFDSELSLVLWDRYPLYQWVPNSCYVDRSSQIRASLNGRLPQKTLMVSRLDGPSPKIVRQMIDDAVAVEQQGLRGGVYLDARGLKKRDGYLEYDANLISLAIMLRKDTDLEVALDNKADVFSPGSCPNTALYVGWYSLAKYVPAFEFVRGAVGYHIASSEAVSLRDGTREYWCKGLLADGVVATLGPVSEPYLAAFPLPLDFTGLLLTGQYSLVECYYYTKKFNSWMMMLLGDPLYRPFAKTPHLKVEGVFKPNQLPLANLKRLILDAGPGSTDDSPSLED
jgi:uncharacterized protein (TIGR03790 family)